MLQIRFLADLPQHVDQLADWHHAQWSMLYADWTLDVARMELRNHARSKRLPTTLVLTEDDRLLGSISLVQEDARELSFIGSPWLASLYVVAAERGRGLGAMLVKALMRHAEDIAVDRLFLFTPEHEAFYRTLGWTVLDHANLKGQKVDVMCWQAEKKP